MDRGASYEIARIIRYHTIDRAIKKLDIMSKLYQKNKICQHYIEAKNQLIALKNEPLEETEPQ